MLEQVVKCFHEMCETNPDFFVDDKDFLDAWYIMVIFKLLSILSCMKNKGVHEHMKVLVLEWLINTVDSTAS